MSTLVFSHNQNCDNTLWFGSLALDGFEKFVFVDETMKPPLFDSYDNFIDHDWYEFIEDSSYM